MDEIHEIPPIWVSLIRLANASGSDAERKVANATNIDETDKRDSVEVHTFLLFCPFDSGTRKRVGAAPQTRSCFSGGTGTGEPEPERCESKAEASQAPGAAEAPKLCRDIGQIGRTERITTGWSQPPREGRNQIARRVARPSWS